MSEPLESRRVLAFSVSLVGSGITFTGTAGSDAMTLSVSPSGRAQHNLTLGGNLVSNIDLDSTQPGEQSLNAVAVTSVNILAGDSNDTIDASAWTGIGLLVYGEGGDDTIKGGAGDDDLRGGIGNDLLEGNGGSDRLDWSDAGQRAGVDTLRGGPGNDLLSGGADSGNIFEGGADSDLADAWFDTATLTNTTFTAFGVLSPSHGIETWNAFIGTDNNDSFDASAWTGSGLLVYGLGGKDTIKGGAGDDDLRGGDGDDVLEGNGGNDRLDWNDAGQRAGVDTLRGGPGNDLLSGGGDSGNVFEGGADSDLADAWFDTATLTNTTFTAFGVVSPNHGIETWNAFFGNDNSNSFDASAWTGSGLLVYGLGGKDTLKGGAGDDDLRGGDGDDVLEGNGGNDRLDWNDAGQRAGVDTLRGGPGNDLLSGGADSGNVFEGGADSDLADAWFDTATLTNTTFTAFGVLSPNHGIETWNAFIGTGNNDSFDASSWTGSGLLVYGLGGKDTLKGGAGDDDLRGGDGDDVLEGNGGNDRLDWNDAGQRAGVDTLRGGSGNDLLSGGGDSGNIFEGGSDSDLADAWFDTATLTNTAFTAFGVISPNHGIETWNGLYGTENNDSFNASAWTGSGLLVYGFGGNDTLKGGATDDDLRGGNGDDVLEGNGGNDRLDWNDAGQRAGVDTLRGGPGNDLLSGGGDSGNIFEGGSDSDLADAWFNVATLTNTTFTTFGVLSPNHGIETWNGLFGTEGNDSFDASAWTGSGLLVFGFGGKDTLKGGTGDDDLRGGDGDDVLEGNGGDDRLDWNDGGQRAGVDTLRGGSGNDLLAGGSDSGNIYEGGSDSDTADAWFDFGTLTSSTFVAFGVVSPNHGIETWSALSGTEADNTFDGTGWTGSRLLIFGNGGNDVLKGGTSDDILYGGPGNDTLDGGLCSDTLFGGNDNDTLIGGSGTNYLFGDEGNDQLTSDPGGVLQGGNGTDAATIVVNWKDPVVVIEPTTVNIDEAVTSYGDLESLVVSKIGTLIRGDLNADGAVDAADAGIMFGNWGTAGDGDLNGDCIVDAADAGILFANWTGDPQPGAVWAAAVDEVWKHERTWL